MSPQERMKPVPPDRGVEQLTPPEGLPHRREPPQPSPDEEGKPVLDLCQSQASASRDWVRTVQHLRDPRFCTY